MAIFTWERTQAFINRLVIVKSQLWVLCFSNGYFIYCLMDPANYPLVHWRRSKVAKLCISFFYFFGNDCIPTIFPKTLQFNR